MYNTAYKSTSTSMQQTKAIVYILICNFSTKYVTEGFEILIFRVLQFKKYPCVTLCPNTDF